MINLLEHSRRNLSVILWVVVTHLLAGGLVVARRGGGLPRLAQQVGQHGAGAGAAALVVARPSLHVTFVKLTKTCKSKPNQSYITVITSKK